MKGNFEASNCRQRKSPLEPYQISNKKKLRQTSFQNTCHVFQKLLLFFRQPSQSTLLIATFKDLIKTCQKLRHGMDENRRCLKLIRKLIGGIMQDYISMLNDVSETKTNKQALCP